MISAVGVVVPARDEAALIGACLAGIRHALAQLPPSIERAVCVVADRCIDDTVSVARAELGSWLAAQVVVNERDVTIGEVRDLGFRQVRAALTGHQAAGVWLLSTDADTTVAPDWATAHLRLARHGIHAVAGTAELADQHLLPPSVAARYEAIRAAACRPDGHGNVYAANLGVRADAYQAVGGFGPVRSGEDQDLWHRLGSAGYLLRYATDPSVTTSARKQGRAPGGIADLLSHLHSDDAALPTAS
jgi:hypothetical protein